MAALSVPLFSFGVMSGIQYASPDKSLAGEGGEELAARESSALDQLEKAISYFREHMATQEFVLNLGNTISGEKPADEGKQDLERAAALFSMLSPMPIAHAVGHKDLSVGRKDYVRSMCFPSGASFYSSELAPGYFLIVLDTTDLSLSWPEGSPQLTEAEAYLRSHPSDSSRNVHLKELGNGGVGSVQLQWLEAQLRHAEQAGQRVIVASSRPFASAKATQLAWNHDEVKSVLLKSKSFVLALAGQDDVGCHENIQHAHFVTVPSLLREAPDLHEPTYGICQFFQNHIIIRGVGAMPTMKLRLPEMLMDV